MTETSKKVRGKGKRPALTHVNMRLPAWVVDYYKQFPNPTGKMREVLSMKALPILKELGDEPAPEAEVKVEVPLAEPVQAPVPAPVDATLRGIFSDPDT